MDANTLLSLSFENTLNGEQGETPLTASGVSFEPGVAGNAAFFANGNMVTFASSGNIAPLAGTFEFFIRPEWNGNDGLNHTFLTWGGGGGMAFGKDAANNLRGLFNRFAISGNPEEGVGISIAAWQANELHYIAYTWDSSAGAIKLYVDGVLRATDNTLAAALPTISAPSFQLGGSDFQPGNLDAALDELRMSDVARTSVEISERYTRLVPEPGSSILMLIGGPVAALRRRQTAR